MHKNFGVLRSKFLTPAEHKAVQKLIGQNQCLGLTIAQLYLTEPPNHDAWIKYGTGVLCFIRMYPKTYKFQLFDITESDLMWECEVDENIEYTCDKKFFHMFESQSCVVGFNFGNEPEASSFHETVTENLQKQIKVVNRSLTVKKPNKKKEKKKQTVHVLEIGSPTDFQHVVHIGHNQSSFNNAEDSSINEIFKRAGVTDQQLGDPKTREFMVNFVQRRSRKKKAAPPRPDPSIDQDTAADTPPPIKDAEVPPVPPPPSRNNVIPIPPKPQYKILKKIRNNSPKNLQAQNVPPPLPSKSAGTPTLPFVPPGAPPPPPFKTPTTSPPPPFKPQSIPGSTHFKLASTPSQPVAKPPSAPPMPPVFPTDIPPLPPTLPPPTNQKRVEKNVPDDRSVFLDSIRKGHQLKSVNERDRKVVVDEEEMFKDDIAAALSKAIAQRERAIQNRDSSSTEWDVDTDEWDEDD